MEQEKLLWPSEELDFWTIRDENTTVYLCWSKNAYEDYRRLSYDYYECGYKTFCDIARSGHDNTKTDAWFLTGIYLVRQGIELGIKALICRSSIKNTGIQDAFKTYCHDLYGLFDKYSSISEEEYLSANEKQWLVKYLESLESIDEKSDMFRFPFDDQFLSQYQNMFLDVIAVANNLLQAFALVKKCIERGYVDVEDEFCDSLEPEFFVFANHGIGNCYLWQSINDNGFYAKVKGYADVIDYIYCCEEISRECKLYPLVFMFRNLIELCLKRIFYSRINHGVSEHDFNSKKKSHQIKKDLWKCVKPVILYYAEATSQPLEELDIVESQLFFLDQLDKHGDSFRYPTTYSLEYKINDKKFDMSNIYIYLKSIVNFFEGCDAWLDDIADYEIEEYTQNWYENN